MKSITATFIQEQMQELNLLISHITFM